jgi:flagellar biosynthesis component FlhA
MNDVSKGLLFVLGGIVFLLLSFILPLPAPLWSVILSASIVLNCTGTVFLIRFIKKSDQREKKSE